MHVNSYVSLRTWDSSGTSISGSIPTTWNVLVALQQLNIGQTNIRCNLIVNADDKMKCVDQSVLRKSPTTSIEAVSLADGNAGVHCNALTIVATGSASVTADPSYHAYTDCRCDTNSFGLNALCYRCPEGCTCTRDVIQNCFPVVQRGSILVTPASPASSDRVVVDGSIAPFSISAILPCPRTVTGSSLCNPDNIAWPYFYRISEQTDASLSTGLTGSDASSSSDAEIDMSSWCYPGHTGRLCAACSLSYFSSGRWCLRCLGEGMHMLILLTNLLLIVALIAYLYAKSPSAVTSAKGLQMYLRRLARSPGDVGSSRSMQPLHSDGPLDLSMPASQSDSFSSEASTAVVAESANPLKLLIFHSQQLSLLLHTSTSLPPVMAGLLSVINSGSTGFSLSSLIALECLGSWTLRHRCWMAVCAPALIGLVAGITSLLSGKREAGSRGGRAMQLQGRDEPLLVTESEANASPPSSSIVPRVYSVCVSLLYFLFFPCAQTVLSAVACTDNRQPEQSYLNLFPNQACDEEWRRTILPPAVLGLLFWLIAFPLGSTLLLLTLRSELASSSDSASAPPSSVSALSVWPVCADLLLPYSTRFWYMEQLLLGRRLLLVAAVTIIPSSSLYLPLVLFSIIQLSALQQHWSRPYVHARMNHGELVSLYLLLINYISALILQTGLTDGGFHQTADLWAVALFVVNGAFLLILLALLFRWVRQWLEARCDARRRPRV